MVTVTGQVDTRNIYWEERGHRWIVHAPVGDPQVHVHKGSAIGLSESKMNYMNLIFLLTN